LSHVRTYWITKCKSQPVRLEKKKRRNEKEAFVLVDEESLGDGIGIVELSVVDEGVVGEDGIFSVVHEVAIVIKSPEGNDVSSSSSSTRWGTITTAANKLASSDVPSSVKDS